MEAALRTTLSWPWGLAMLPLAACPFISADRHADFDADGVPGDVDCDDQDDTLGAEVDDPGCDGVITVVGVDPLLDAINVRIEAPVVVTFSDPVDPDTLDGLRVVVDGVLDGAPGGEMAGVWTLAEDDRVATFVPDRGAFQEFGTLHRVDVDGVRSRAGAEVAPGSAFFRTVVLDPDYAYRFRNVFGGGALALDRDSEAGQAAWFPPGSESVWGVVPVDESHHLLVHQGSGRALEGGDGSALAFGVVYDTTVFTGMMWRLVSATANPEPKPFMSPDVYWLETLFQGPERTLGYFEAEIEPVRFAMKDKGGSIFADHVWIVENVGRR